jgi:hypothetical protein
MEAKLPIQIKLTKPEQKLFNQIDFEGAKKGFGEVSIELMQSLEKRSVILEIRRRYFMDPELNPNGRGKSRYDGFGGEVYERPQFLNYLRYFILGPDLPKETMKEFCRIVNEGDLEGDERELLRIFVRKEMRGFDKLDRHYKAEEFYKLALECITGDPFLPKSIREAAMKVR